MAKELVSSQESELFSLIREAGAFFDATPAQGAIPFMDNIKYLFDLDKLWAEPIFRKQIIKITDEAIHKMGIKYTVVAGLTSRTGAFGTVPIAAIIANKYKLPLCILDESQLTQYSIHPHSSSDYYQIKKQQILIIKDVVIGGASIERAYTEICKHQGILSGILLFIDLCLYDSWKKDLPNDLTLLTLAKGNNFHIQK